jgi:type II secretory pathway component GspD/PulD (secretin)
MMRRVLQMSRSFYLKILLCVVSITLIYHGYADAQPEETKSAVSDNVGREDPFLRVDSEKGSSLLRRVFGAGSRSTTTQPAPELFVQTVVLKFLNAKNLKTVLENMLSGYGTMAVDTKSNSLIISDTKGNLGKILGQIKRADKTPPQIMIEVVILDVKLDDDTQIGINWDILSDKIYDIGYRQNFTTRLGSTIESSTTTGSATAFNTTGTGGNFALVSGTIRNVVHLLQEKKDVEILASPRVLLVSGGTASIETVEEIPYREQTQTSGGGVLSSTEFKEVGVKLNVTAIVTDSNDILITVTPEQNVNTGVFGIDDVPIIDTRKAKTSLLLKDGQVVVIGGLRRQEKTSLREQVPLLGDLPLLGFLFKRTKITVSNSELLVFVSPHIYTDQELTEKELAKFNEITKRPLLEMPATWRQGLLPFEMLAEPEDANDI